MEVVVIRNGRYNVSFALSNVVLVLLEHGSCEGKWEKLLDVYDIKTVFCWKVGTPQI